MLTSVSAAPLLLLSEPALMVSVLAVAPRAVVLLRLSWPALSVVPPLWLLAPESVSVPLPALVRPKAPETVPPTVRLPASTVTCVPAPSATAPVPRFRSFVPAKVKSPFQFCALLPASVRAPPLLLSSVVPPEMVSAPVPIAAALPMLSRPTPSVVPPL